MNSQLLDSFLDSFLVSSGWKELSGKEVKKESSKKKKAGEKKGKSEQHQRSKYWPFGRGRGGEISKKKMRYAISLISDHCFFFFLSSFSRPLLSLSLSIFHPPSLSCFADLIIEIEKRLYRGAAPFLKNLYIKPDDPFFLGCVVRLGGGVGVSNKSSCPASISCPDAAE